MSARSEFWLCYRPFEEDDLPVQLVNRARAAIVVDTAERAQAAGFDRVRVFSTVDFDGFDDAGDLEVVQTQSGQLIGSVVSAAARSVSGPVCYAGSGMAAMTVEDWSTVLETIGTGVATANRMFSCDWIGVPDGRLLEVVAPERVDNRFALMVRDRYEVKVVSFPRSARSLLDVDTPADLVVLKMAMQAGSLELGAATRSELLGQRELDRALQTAMAVFDVMTHPNAELFVAGRVSGSDWAIVDRDTSCRVRILSEERGLRTRGKRAASILGALYEQMDPARFVEQLRELGSAVIWDTRPLFSHLGWDLTRADRFAADMGRWDVIVHEELRELVAMLDGASVVMGGHSLVSGGMLAGIDAAWTHRELSG